MKCQALFTVRNTHKKSKYRLLLRLHELHGLKKKAPNKKMSVSESSLYAYVQN